MATTSGTRRDFQALEARRMEAAALFEQGKSQAEVVRALGVSRQSASPAKGGIGRRRVARG